MNNLSQCLKDKAKVLGLAPVGITSAAPLAKARTVLEQINTSGCRIPFTTGDIERRTNPNLVWPEAESLVMVGLPFKVPAGGPKVSGELRGYWAAGTCGNDYHDALLEKLRALGHFLQETVPGTRVAVFVDTGPLLERALAYRAGLGVWGENSFIIRPQTGPAFFLGGLATNAPLAPDQPLSTSCLKCGRCRDACPTAALSVPYRLDYRRCLSYWTQAKELMPAELRPLLGNRLYGCDTCVRACPLIEKSPQEGVTVDLIRFLAFTEEEFQKEYGTSSAAWRGRTVLQRNAVLALGNSGRRQVVPILIQCLKDRRTSVRAAAAWGLGRHGGQRAYVALREQLKQEPEASVRTEIEFALQRIST
ncbi:MAG: tRNA epoxyqueuosine(34) reductase QueG [bacterium]